jgi:hypothetical protein
MSINKILIRRNIRIRLAEAQNWRCCWCGVSCVQDPSDGPTGVLATIEHVIPRGHGGTDCWFNLVMACYNCNHARGSDFDSETQAIATSNGVYPNNHIGPKYILKGKNAKKRVQHYLENSDLRQYISRGKTMVEKIKQGVSHLSFDDWLLSTPPKYHAQIREYVFAETV